MGVAVVAQGRENDLAEAVQTFVELRPRLMAIGYRLLASRVEAEDVVQETWVRWQNIDRTTVVDPPALLATMTRRLAINVIDSAHHRHEACVALSDTAAFDAAAFDADGRRDARTDPAEVAETRDGVEQALRIMLERLNPRERAAFVLREAFGYSYPQIAEFLHLGAANCRQLVSRARKHLAADRRAAVSSTAHRRFLTEFTTAAQYGDLTGLEELLAQDLAG